MFLSLLSTPPVQPLHKGVQDAGFSGDTKKMARCSFEFFAVHMGHILVSRPLL